ncbi:hypothetical protein JXB31_00935 [Candidatus Woesearchaeota archaeon]|nr:hypothetical protein [Candidatus Woesearchaeota archaeon]
MNRSRKAQGALEFLMTYGWAFLVILFMIGALAYFGVLNPSRFLPDRCNFGTPFLCKTDQVAVRAQNTDTVLATVINNYGSSIFVYNGTFTTDSAAITGGACLICLDTNSDGSCTNADQNISTTGGAFEWEEGKAYTIVTNCPGAANLGSGSKIKFIFNVNWYPGSSSIAYKQTGGGEIYSAVQ